MKGRLGWMIGSMVLLSVGGVACDGRRETAMTGDKIVKTNEEWCGILTPEQYRILREKGTETAFTGKYYNHHEEGAYVCAACGEPLFSSLHKFDSGTGWPSYWQPAQKGAVKEAADDSHGMRRVEVLCASCGSHLGHVFTDGPEPTGLRYCINSVALDFKPAHPKKK